MLWINPVFLWTTCVFPVDNMWTTSELSTPTFYQISVVWIMWKTPPFVHSISTDLSTAFFLINKGFATLFNIIHIPTTITTNNKIYLYYNPNPISKGDHHVNHL